MISDCEAGHGVVASDFDCFQHGPCSGCETDQIENEYLTDFGHDLSTLEPPMIKPCRVRDGADIEGGMPTISENEMYLKEHILSKELQMSISVDEKSYDALPYSMMAVDMLESGETCPIEEGNMGYLHDDCGEDSRGSARSSCRGLEVLETASLEAAVEASPVEHMRHLEEQQDDREAKVQAVLDTALDWLLFPFESSDEERANEALLDETDDWFGDNVQGCPSWQALEEEDNGSSWSLQFGDDHLSTDGSRDGVDKAQDVGANGVTIIAGHGEEECYRKPLYHLSSSSSMAIGESNCSPATTEDNPPKRKRGRPKGSGKKKSSPMDTPRGNRSPSLSVQHVSVESNVADGGFPHGRSEAPMQKRKRGRPAKCLKGRPSSDCLPTTRVEETKLAEEITVSDITHVQRSSGGSLSISKVEQSGEKRGRGRPKKTAGTLAEEVWSDSQASDSDWELGALEAESTGKAYLSRSRTIVSRDKRKTGRPRGRPPKNRKTMQEVTTDLYSVERSPRGTAPEPPIPSFGLEGSGLDDLMVGSMRDVTSGMQVVVGSERVLASPPGADPPQKRKRGRPPKNPRVSRDGLSLTRPLLSMPAGKLLLTLPKGAARSAMLKRDSPETTSAECCSAGLDGIEIFTSAESMDGFQ